MLETMTPASLLLFASVYFVAVAAPGPGMAAVIARGLGQGMKAAPAFIAGFLLGDLIWFTIAATGLAVIAKTFATLFWLSNTRAVPIFCFSPGRYGLPL
jgi:threonine/homoserine/homoserine lactone efflux protein